MRAATLIQLLLYSPEISDRVKLSQFVFKLKAQPFCHEADKQLRTWTDLKAAFLTTFGKTRVDFNIGGESSGLLASEDPVAFVYQVLNVVNTTSPNATEAEKVNRLFAELLIHMKPGIVRNPPQTVRSFTGRLRDLSREAAYVRTSMLQAGVAPELAYLGAIAPN